MNLVILYDSDFSQPDMARLAGRRREHLLSVCKVKPGDTIRAGRLNGAIGHADVVSVDRLQITLRVTFDSPPPPPAPVTLIMALPRPKSLRKAIEVATCMGVKRIIVIESWRVEKSYWTSPVLGTSCLEEHAILGLEQGRDTVLPAIEVRRRFRPFVEDEVPELVKGTTALVAHPYGDSQCPRALDGPVTLAIGPEGGFIPYEVELLQKQGFRAVTLGPRILRVEFAIAALLGRIF